MRNLPHHCRVVVAVPTTLYLNGASSSSARCAMPAQLIGVHIQHAAPVSVSARAPAQHYQNQKKKKELTATPPLLKRPCTSTQPKCATQPETSHRAPLPRLHLPLLPPHRRTKKQSHLPQAKRCARSDAMPSSGRRTINTMRAHNSPHGSPPEAQYTAASDNNLLGPIVRNKRYCSAASHGQQQQQQQ